jgi:hypothetical protein
MCPFVKHLYWHFCITSCSIYLKQLGPNYDSMPSFTILWQHLVFIYLFSAWKDILLWFILVRTRYKVVFCVSFANSLFVPVVTAFRFEALCELGNEFKSWPMQYFLPSFFCVFFRSTCKRPLTDGIAPWGDFWVGCEGGRVKLNREFGCGRSEQDIQTSGWNVNIPKINVSGHSIKFEG